MCVTFPAKDWPVSCHLSFDSLPEQKKTMKTGLFNVAFLQGDGWLAQNSQIKVQQNIGILE